MPTSTSEKDLKTVLRQLLEEKKAGGVKKKFEPKLSALHQNALFREALEAKEKECQQLRAELALLKPAVKRLAVDLKDAKRELEETAPDLESSLREELFLAQEKQEEERRAFDSKVQALLFEKATLEQSLSEFADSLDAKEAELTHFIESKQTEVTRLEAERIHLADRLAETLREVQNKSALIKTMQEQMEAIIAESPNYQASEKLVAMEAAYEEKLSVAYAALKESSKQHVEAVESLDKLSLRLLENEARLEENEEQISALKGAYQSALAASEEKEAEVRKAQQHLAKKIKENAMLQDLLERLKMQMNEQSNILHAKETELTRALGTLQMQQMHEEKLEILSKEIQDNVSLQLQQWQEKYFILHEEWQTLKAENDGLLKIKTNHDSALFLLQQLRNTLKGEES